MNITAIRATAFGVGMLIAGCVYTSHTSVASQQPGASPAFAVYPGAHPTSHNPDGDSSDRTLHVMGASVHFIAVRYDVADPPGKVIAFYRTAFAGCSNLVTKAGGPHTHIPGFTWTSEPNQTTVACGNKFVAIKPIKAGTEFATILVGPEKDPGT